MLCDRRTLVESKGKVCKKTIRPALLCGMEFWANKKEHAKKLSVSEMRMLRWMHGKSKEDKSRSERIRGP